MFSFILEIVIMLGLSVLLLMLARTLPRIDDTVENSKEDKFKTHWFISYLEKTDDWLLLIFEKFLRRLKIWILKFDNVISEKLNKFKKKETQKDIKLPVEIEKIEEEKKETAE